MRISAGYNPEALAITPDGTTAYVVNRYGFDGPSTVTPIQIATGTREKPIPVGSGPVAIALTPRADQGGKK
jgi:DNA-binding beta-propeller fold protein YncE